MPKDRRLWLFSAWHGESFADNSKYLFNYVLRNESSIQARWLTRNRSLFRQMKLAGLPVLYAYSLGGILSQLRAGVVIFSHSVDWDFCPYLVGRRTIRVQLWHGMPIRKIGFDHAKGAPPRLNQLLKRLFLPFRVRRLDMMIATGEIDKQIYRTAFRLEETRIYITGFPRNDALFPLEGGSERKPTTEVLYLPTFNGNFGSEHALYEEPGFGFERMDAWLKERDIVLHIKTHPANPLSERDLERLKDRANIRILESDVDIHESLKNFDIYLTDFSSIYFDFLITGKPIIIAPLGAVSPLASARQDFYFDEAVLAPDGIRTTWTEVLGAVERYKEEGRLSDKHLALRRKFHTHLDGLSSMRVFREILNLSSV